MIENFDSLWRAHFEWNQGVLIKEIRSLKTADIYFGNTPEEWFNFALPKVEKPVDLDLKEIRKNLSPVSSPTAIYLFEEQVKSAFPEFLSQKGYGLALKDTWMVFGKKREESLQVEIPVKHIGLFKFPDYKKVAVEAYREAWGCDNRPYVEICRKILAGEIKSKTPGFSAEFFVVYEKNKPVAEAGLFLTKQVACFHNDATLKKYQKRGYHTVLIKERIKFCLARGIKTLYALVEDEDQSFRNYSRCGFKPWQTAKLFTLKS